MTQVVDKLRSNARSLGIMSGIGLAAAYLIFLSAVSVVLVVMFLTAHQFQHAIKTAELSGKPVALWQVIELKKQWTVVSQQVSKTAENLGLAQEELSAKERELQVARDKATAEDTNLREFEVQVVGKLAELGAEGSNLEVLQQKDRNSRFTSYLELGRKLGGNDAAVRLLIQKYQEAYSAFLEAAGSEAVLDSQVITLRISTSNLEDYAKKSQQQFSELLGGPENDNAKRQLLGNFLSQLSSLDGSWLGVLGTFATMEPDLLTLLLVLAMGTLGGTLHLARLFIEDTKAPVGYFLYRPFLGAIAALVIFVVARTGIFVVAEPSSQNSGAPLSPFFISFVAIVSGLLAEQAIASIQGTGEKWFTGTLQDNTERYALRVADEALKQKKDKAQLQKYAEMEDAHFRALFDGSKKVPVNVQKVVAVWLGKPVRELFTELPPPAGTS